MKFFNDYPFINYEWNTSVPDGKYKIIKPYQNYEIKLKRGDVVTIQSNKIHSYLVPTDKDYTGYDCIDAEIERCIKENVAGPAIFSISEKREYGSSISWYTEGYPDRDDGPGWLHLIHDNNNYEYGWYRHGHEITFKVEDWIVENNFPEWKDWTDEHKIIYKMIFCDYKPYRYK